MQKTVDGLVSRVFVKGLSSKQMALLDLLEKARWWNTRHDWGINDDDFPTRLPDISNLRRSEVVIPGIYLPDVREHSGLARSLSQFWAMLNPDGFDKKSLRHSDSIVVSRCVGFQPGCRGWIAVDFEANRGESVENCRRNYEVAGRLATVEPILAMALYDHILDRMDGSEGHSFINLSGLFYQRCRQLAGYSEEDCRTPFLMKLDDAKEISIAYAPSSAEHPKWSSPTVRHLPLLFD